jgi:predicted transcriptional regulator
MPAIVKLQLSLQDFAEAIASLDLEEKRQLQEMIEQQIFEAEEALYEDDPETEAEIEAVRAEYAAGEFLTMDEYLANRSKQSS